MTISKVELTQIYNSYAKISTHCRNISQPSLVPQNDRPRQRITSSTSLVHNRTSWIEYNSSARNICILSSLEIATKRHSSLITWCLSSTNLMLRATLYHNLRVRRYRCLCRGLSLRLLQLMIWDSRLLCSCNYRCVPGPSPCSAQLPKKKKYFPSCYRSKRFADGPWPKKR